MGSDVNRLRLQAQCQWLAAAVVQRTALGQDDPFLQMLALAEAHQLVALENLQVKRASADDQKNQQENNFHTAHAQAISFERTSHGRTMT